MNNNIQNLKKEWREKNIMILGFGQEGKDTFKFLRKFFPEKTIGIADQKKLLKIKKNNKIKLHLGEKYLESIKDYDLIIKSPGIPFKIIPKSTWPKITSQTEIFLNNCPGKIIGITGTKGKGTTAFLIYQILKKSFKRKIKIKLIGNIGQPVLNLLPSATKKDIYVYELSSHQLHNLKKSPHIAVFLNIYPEHLDYFKDFEEYVRAKSNIFLWQKSQDYLIYNKDNKIIKEIIRKAKNVSREQKIPIKGKNYEINKEAAGAISKILNIEKEVVEEVIKGGKSLPHRMELIGNFKNIIFYNDSAATMPEATIAGIQSLGNRLETIILGGSDKNLEFKNLAKEILKSNIKNIILFPETGEKIYNSIVRHNKEKKHLNYFFVKEKNKKNYIKKSIKTAIKHTEKNKTCLFSPASASFNIFKDYKERGDLFKKYLKNE